jgi:uncharacterized membrane protein
MKVVFLFIMAGLYVVAGINHLVHPLFYYSIMPPWIAWPATMVLVSGVLEILLGLLLLPAKTRRLAAWGIVALLIAVFPANIQMMLNYHKQDNPYLWITIIRLPLQFVLIWWAYQYTKATTKVEK